MSNYDYPAGAEYDPKAPWNQVDPKPKKIKVTVSITLSKTLEVEVSDYITEEEVDEEGNHNIYYDYSNCDLEQAVRDQITLPSKAYKARESLEDLKDWVEDDFAVNLEE